MIILFGLLTILLIVMSLFLILLVLVQLPKKDAGTGMAFGGAAADALFGAVSGNVLTKITKFTIIGFFAVVLVLGWVQDHMNTGPDMNAFAKKVAQQQQASATTMAPPPVAPTATHPSAATTNAPALKLLSTPAPAAPTPDK